MLPDKVVCDIFVVSEIGYFSLEEFVNGPGQTDRNYPDTIVSHLD
jgi:hypothetical protein